MKEGEVGFVKHLGNVKFIEKSNLRVEVKNKREEAQIKGTDEYQIMEIVEEQKSLYEQAREKIVKEYDQEKERKDKVLDSCNSIYHSLLIACSGKFQRFSTFLTCCILVVSSSTERTIIAAERSHINQDSAGQARTSQNI